MKTFKKQRDIIQEKQDAAFRKMSAEKKLKTTFGLNRLIFKIAKDSAKNKKILLKKMYV